MSEARGSASGSWQQGNSNWFQSQSSWTASDDAYLSAARLSAALRNGQRLSARDTAIVLRPAEQALYCESFSQYTYSQRATVSYSRGFFAAFGSPAWLAASLGGSALYNNYQRTKAEAEAAAQWRLVDHGIVHVTNQRLCLQGRLSWVDIPLADIRALDALPDGVVIHRQGQSPVMISTSATAYLYVLLSFLISGQVIRVPLPVDFVDRARRAGREIPPQDPDASPGFGADPWHSRGPLPSAPPSAHEAPRSPVAGAWSTTARASAKVDVLGRPYADWGTRAVAFVIDTLVIISGWALLIAVVVAATKLRTPPAADGGTNISGVGVTVIVVSLLALVAFTFGYHLLHGRESGQTLGKRAVAIQVRDAQTGGPISYARAFGRYLAGIFAWIILPILVFVDLLWPLWDTRLQTLHDKAVNTVVIRTERHRGPGSATQPPFET